MERYNSEKINNSKVQYIKKINGKDHIVGIDLAAENDKQHIEYHMNLPYMQKITSYED